MAVAVEIVDRLSPSRIGDRRVIDGPVNPAIAVRIDMLLIDITGYFSEAAVPSADTTRLATFHPSRLPVWYVGEQSTQLSRQ